MKFNNNKCLFSILTSLTPEKVKKFAKIIQKRYELQVINFKSTKQTLMFHKRCYHTLLHTQQTHYFEFYF